MDAEFDVMMGILQDNIADTDNILNELRAIEVPPKIVITPAEPHVIEVYDFEEKYNLLVQSQRCEFKNETIYGETDIFTAPQSTTNTMEGFLSNVTFHEQDLIENVSADDDILVYKCNYGKVIYEGYTEPIRKTPTNRGRKKCNKKKKLRKKQGNGTDFNSQITMIVRADDSQEISSEIKTYKFKIFRTGKIQLPGVRQSDIDNVIAGAKKVLAMMNFYLHTGCDDPMAITRIININPVMKNYKFSVKLPKYHFIDLLELKKILKKYKQLQDGDNNVYKNNTPIKMIKYSRQDTKLSIKFLTPIYRNPQKRTRVNIFMRGKINILGALYAENTDNVCDFLHTIFADHWDEIVVKEGLPLSVISIINARSVKRVSEPNILMADDSELLPEFNDLPVITDLEYADIMRCATEAYDEIKSEADAILNDIMREIW